MSDVATLDRVLSHASDCRVLVIGDLMLDEYQVGNVDRTSPEAPVPVVHVQTQRSGLGGAANVAHQLAVLGASVEVLGRVGTDPAGETLLGRCREVGIEVGRVTVDATVPTTRKIRVIADRQQVVRIDVEERTPIAPEVIEALEASLLASTAPDIIVVSDYAKGIVTDELLDMVRRLATRWGISFLIDPKSPDLRRYRGATIIKANRAEFEAAIDRAFDERLDAMVEDYNRLRLAAGSDNLIVTLGERGLVVVEADGQVTEVFSSADEVYDVSGAGDTVLAVLTVGLIAGEDLPGTARLANAAGGLVVRRAGVAVVTGDDLRQHLAATERVGAMDLGALDDAVAEWRRSGRRIVFTNGCFDLFHPGHLHMLRQASRLGDVLIVGLNSDASVRSLKGASRPVIGEVERATIVSALRDVDAVVLFDDADPRQLIARIVPDVLVKGADYRFDEIVGADLVTAAGGEVKTVPLLEGWSTSATLDRILDHGGS